MLNSLSKMLGFGEVQPNHHGLACTHTATYYECAYHPYCGAIYDMGQLHKITYDTDDGKDCWREQLGCC